MATEEFAGPVDYASFAVPGGANLGGALRALQERVSSRAIELLDLDFVSRDDAGKPQSVALDTLNLGDFDASLLEAAASDLLEADDLEAVVEELAPGHVAVVIVFEDRCLAPVAAQIAAVGGREVFAGGIPIDDLEDLLKKTEGEEQ